MLLLTKIYSFFLVSFALKLELNLTLKGFAQSHFSQSALLFQSASNTVQIHPAVLFSMQFTIFLPSQPCLISYCNFIILFMAVPGLAAAQAFF